MDSFERTEWYYWPCQELEGATNMFIDHHLARSYGTLLDQPLLRFFTWSPHCISLGYHQNPSDIDQQRCREQGIDLVRRPTGGRAILHAEELTYSVVYPFPELDVAQFYRQVHLPLVSALQAMEVPAEFEPAQADFRNIYKTDRAYLCFATSARFEIEIAGRKLVGSAQRVYQNSILQHGSLLLGPVHENLVDFLNIDSQKRENIRKYIREHTTILRHHRQDVTAGELADLIRENFASCFGIRFTHLKESPALRKFAGRIPDVSEFSIIRNRPSPYRRPLQ